MLKWGWVLHGDQDPLEINRDNAAIPGENEGDGLMPTLKALGGIYLLVHVSAPCISSPTTSSIIGQV